MSINIVNVLSLFDGRYEVTSDGQVFSFARKHKTKLIGKISNSGYRTILLTVNGKRLYRNVHRLVGEAFIKNPENKPQINHKNGIKTDNRVDNLEWVSSKENHIHARDSYLYPYLKINMDIAQEIRLLYKTGKFTHRSLASKFGLNKTHIGLIINNKRWITK